jgi:hypothetical protein
MFRRFRTFQTNSKLPHSCGALKDNAPYHPKSISISIHALALAGKLYEEAKFVITDSTRKVLP